VVSNYFQDYDATNNLCFANTTSELYEINEHVPKPLLDEEGMDLLQLGPLTPLQQENYAALTAQMMQVLDSQPACPGDGNIDGVVNGRDLENWLGYRLLTRGKSSWYDINMDGLTDYTDLALLRKYLGKCPQ